MEKEPKLKARLPKQAKGSARGKSKKEVRHQPPPEAPGPRPEPQPAPKVSNFLMDIRDVSPDQAAIWLEGKCPNRTVNEDIVRRYARDMKAGAWHLNGETIVFDTQGGLLDGQHRLWAVVESGATVRMCIVYGAAKESMATYDMGRGRTFANVLQIEGLAQHDSRGVSAAARWIYWYDNYRRGSLQISGTVSHAELMQVVENHPMVLSAAKAVRERDRLRRLVTKGVLVFVVTGAMERDHDKALDFLDLLSTGTDLYEGHPVHTLREKMIQDRANVTRLPQMVVAAYTVKAWNYFYKGRDLKHLRWAQNDALRPEAFPTFED